MDSKAVAFAVAAVILIGLGAALFFFAEEEEPERIPTTYNGYFFVQENGLWVTEWRGRDGQRFTVRLNYHPSSVEDIPIEGEVSSNFTNSQLVFVTHDPREGGLGHVALATAEVSVTLASVFERDLVAACTQNVTEACASRPIVGCDSTNAAVLYIKESDRSFVELDDNCVTIHGRDEGLIQAAEKAIYVWYDIIQSS